MKKSNKTIIYMLIALVVAVSAVFVDFGSCYAQSYSEDVYDADWHYFNSDGEGSSFNIYDYDNVGTDIEIPVDSKIKECKYIDNFTYATTGSDDNECYVTDYAIGSNDEVVLVYENYGVASSNGFWFSSSSSYVEGTYAYLLCRSDFYIFGGHVKDKSLGSTYNFSTREAGAKGFQLYCIPFELGIYRYFKNHKAINSHKLKVFSSVADARNYLETGDSSAMAWQGGEPKQTYSPELAFSSFDMSVHDSNSFDDYYIDFVYKCPDSWLGKDVKLIVNQTWDYDIVYFNNKGTSNPFSSAGSNTFPLSVSRNSVSVPLGQFDCLKKVVSDNFLGSSSETKRRVLGSSYEAPSGSWFTFEGLPLKADASYRVDKSFLSLSCVVYVDGVAGHEYLGALDLVSGDNSMSTYTPDSGGNYTYNNDYKKGGRYYTDVGKDAAGNTTYNYYYYNTDNSKHEVTSKDSHDNTFTTTEASGNGGGGSASGDNSNNNVNNPTFNNNNNITIEGDTINNDVNNIVGSNTSSETNKNFIEKFLGFFQLLENNSFLGVWGKVFGWLPPGISSVITTALGIGAGVGLFRFFRR